MWRASAKDAFHWEINAKLRTYVYERGCGDGQKGDRIYHTAGENAARLESGRAVPRDMRGVVPVEDRAGARRGIGGYSAASLRAA